MACDACDGTGFKVTELPDGTECATRCACVIASSDAILATAGVPRRERTFTEAGLSDSQKRCLDLVWPALSRGESVLLMGPTGRGKTGVAVCAMRRYVDAGKTVAWAHVDSWMRKIRETYHAPVEDGHLRVTESSLLRELVNSEFAVVDDFGANPDSEWAIGMLYSVVSSRDSEMQPTIYTTNLLLEGADAKSIERLYGERISSRLGRCVKFPLTQGPDTRRR